MGVFPSSGWILLMKILPETGFEDFLLLRKRKVHTGQKFFLEIRRSDKNSGNPAKSSNDYLE